MNFGTGIILFGLGILAGVSATYYFSNDACTKKLSEAAVGYNEKVAKIKQVQAINQNLFNFCPNEVSQEVVDAWQVAAGGGVKQSEE